MKRVALIRGDGVGPELVDAMVSVIEASGADLELVKCDAGYEWWKEHGGDSFIPEETWRVLKSADACFKGPTTTIPDPRLPKSVAVSIRQAFDLYANVRPIRSMPNSRARIDLDFICVREATEGLYSGLDFRISDDMAITIRKITKTATRKVARFAYELLRSKGWARLVVVTKANIMRNTDHLFLEVVEELRGDYPGVEIEHYFIDNMAQQLVKNPERFNESVILGSNLYMDVISELASGHLGSIGMVYSANIGDGYAMFEPAHGSAPKYKGMDKVNPTATILSGAWMLEYLGEEEEARAIFDAVYEVFKEGRYLTYDLGGSARLSEMAGEVARKVRERLGR